MKTTSPSLNHQQYNILDASSQHPQIKSPALAQTAPNIHQMGHQLPNNTSPPNSANKKILEKSNTTMRWGNELVMSAHEGPKSQLPSHEAPRASPREHWAQPSNMHPQPGPKPAHQQSEVNPPMSQKEHIKRKGQRSESSRSWRNYIFRDRESYISNNFRWSKLPIVRRVGPHPTSPLT